MSAVVSPIRKPLITGNKTYHQITEDLISPTEKTPTKEWVIGFVISVAVLTFGVFLYSVDHLGRYRVMEPEQNHQLVMGYH